MFVQLREINVAYRFVQTGTDAVSAPLDISHTVTLECNLQFKSNKNKANCFSFSKMIYFSLQIQLNSRPTFCLSFQPFIRAWSSRQSTFFQKAIRINVISGLWVGIVFLSGYFSRMSWTILWSDGGCFTTIDNLFLKIFLFFLLQCTVGQYTVVHQNDTL